MRYATTPGWLYVMLIVMGLGFIGGAVAFYLFVPQPTGTLVGAIWLVMGAGFVFSRCEHCKAGATTRGFATRGREGPRR